MSGVLNTHFIVANLIKSFGTDEQKPDWLPKMATGEIRGAFSLSEPDAGSDVPALRTKATRDGDDYIVNGTKMWVTNGRAGRRRGARAPTHARGHHLLPRRARSRAESFEGITVSRNIHKLGYNGVETVEMTYSDHRIAADTLLGGPETWVRASTR